MTYSIRRALVAVSALAIVSGATVLPAMAAPVSPQAWSAQSASYAKQDGLLPLFVDATTGKVMVQLPPAAADGVLTEVIHHTLLNEAFGSAQIRLDRGQFGPSRLLQFRRVGNKVLAIYKNPSLQGSGSELESRAADNAFADSVVWSGDVVSTLADGSVIIDLTGFFSRDAWGVRQSLNSAGAGTFRSAPELTLTDPSSIKVFPENIELETIFTYASENPGQAAHEIAPDATSVSVRVHHSFIKLPEAGYVTRKFDTRAGQGDTRITDFSTPLGQPLVDRLARRFRLEKTDPSAARSTVKEPIVFYVDNSAPEPIRSALLEGARWWEAAFDAAGYIDAYKVEILPDDVDPMDSRYNIIFWVNRLTRSWSYGQTVTDPRTGEIIRGSVLLGSQRTRQNIIMFEGLAGVANTGQGGSQDPVQVALARVRQLSAHEVGHALGFQHNFAASTQERASVMDYPAARVRVKDGEIDFTDAYGVGLGDWDVFTVDALYGPDEGLEQRIIEATSRLRFGADIDGRSDSGGLIDTSTWDNGADPVEELAEVMKVRQLALSRFGLGNLPAGAPVSDLRRRIVPTYLYHRFQTAAAAKVIGGYDYRYGVRATDGSADGQVLFQPASPQKQRAAADAILATIAPSALVFTPEQLTLLSAQHTASNDPQYAIELFGTREGRFFDPGVAAETAAEITLLALYAPERLNRLVEHAAMSPSAYSLSNLLDQSLGAVFNPTISSPAEAEVARRVQFRTVLMLSRYLNNVPAGTTPGAVRPRTDPVLSTSAAAIVSSRLSALARQLANSRASDPVQKAHDQWLANLITDDKAMADLLASGRYDVRIPPGEPI